MGLGGWFGGVEVGVQVCVGAGVQVDGCVVSCTQCDGHTL